MESTVQRFAATRPWPAVAGPPVLRLGLLENKLRPPPATRATVPRARLDQRFARALRHGSLVVSAPAGAGKTQAALAWVRAPGRGAVAWLTLDEADRDRVRLLRYVLAALGSTAPGRRALGGLSVAPDTDGVGEELLALVADRLGRVDDDVVLVLDDAGSVVGSPAEELLAWLLQQAGGRLHLLVLGRARPRLGQARLILEGSVEELGASDLTLSREEVRHLLELRGAPAGQLQVGEVMSRTEGWVAGVEMAAALLRRRPASRLPEDPALVTDYLVDEVLDAQPSDVREFLLRAAVANPVCGDLADALSGGTDGAGALARLERDNLFLTCLHDGSWYHWHPMFAAALRQRLSQEAPELLAPLHLAAARWHGERGSPVEAVRHAVAGGEQRWAAELLASCWLDLAVAGESALLRSLLHLFDEDLRSTEPELAVICSFLRLRGRDLEDAERCAGTAVSTVHRLPPGHRQDAVQAMSAVIGLHVATLTGEAAPELHADAARLVIRLGTTRSYLPHRRRELLALLLHHLGAYESVHLLGDPQERLRSALSHAQLLHRPELELRAHAQLAAAALAAGRLQEARDHARLVIDADREGRGTGPHATTTAYAALGAVELLLGDLAPALQHLSQAQAAVDPADRVNQLRVGMLTHSTLLVLDRVAQARSQLESLEGLVAGWEPPGWGREMIRVQAVEQLLAEDRYTEAMTDLQPGRGPVDPAAQVIRDTWLGEVLRRTGQAEPALPLLTAALRLDSPSPALLFATVSRALVLDALGRRDEALEELDRSLGRAGSEGLLYPYLRLGTDVRPLLVELLERGTAHEHLVVALLERLHPGRRGAPLRGTFEPLTTREREILRAVQGRSTNDEVASRLFISANTLRTHLKHIHRKLGTTSRQEAVRRARGLGII